MKKLTATLTAAILALGLMALPALAEDAPAPVGCATVEVIWGDSGTPFQGETISRDPDVLTSMVGDYLWIQYLSDGSSNSEANVFSVLIPEGAETATACTTLHDVEGPDVPQGPDAPVAEVTVERPAPAKVAKVVTTIEKLPEVEAWITAGGLVIL